MSIPRNNDTVCDCHGANSSGIDNAQSAVAKKKVGRSHWSPNSGHSIYVEPHSSGRRLGKMVRTMADVQCKAQHGVGRSKTNGKAVHHVPHGLRPHRILRVSRTRFLLSLSMSGSEAYSPQSDSDDYAPSEQQHTPTPFFPHSQAHAQEYEACVRGVQASATSEDRRPKRMAAEQC